jgi:hypothetical protein
VAQQKGALRLGQVGTRGGGGGQATARKTGKNRTVCLGHPWHGTSFLPPRQQNLIPARRPTYEGPRTPLSVGH